MNISVHPQLKLFKIFLILATIISTSVSIGFEKEGIDCYEIPEYFNSYYEAHNIIFNANYNFTDYIDTYRSSWIRSAGYLSCDGYYGFLFIQTDNNYYIHQNVPVDYWYGFRDANSYGGFYNYYLRDNFRLKIWR